MNSGDECPHVLNVQTATGLVSMKPVGMRGGFLVCERLDGKPGTRMVGTLHVLPEEQSLFRAACEWWLKKH